MLAIFDWALIPRRHEDGWRIPARIFIQRNGFTYVAILCAGLVYLAFRRWALGEIISTSASNPLSWLGHLHEICYIYLRYWAMLFWPTYGMNPIHEYAREQFLQPSAKLLLLDLAAITTIGSSFYFSFKRSKPIACITVMMTCGLLPVLHIAPIAFEPSLYHECYIMTSLAGMCAMLPLLRPPRILGHNAHLIRPLAGIIGCLWLIFAIIGIRMTIPLWSNSTNLWRWVLLENPSSMDAKNNLLIAYIGGKNYAEAHKLIDRLLIDPAPCANCMLNAAMMAVSEGDPSLAAKALEKVRDSAQITTDKKMYRNYLLTTGQMLILRNQPGDAEGIFQAANSANPRDPRPRLELARAFALQGKAQEAHQAGDSAILLLPANQQASASAALTRLLARTTGHLAK